MSSPISVDNALAAALTALSRRQKAIANNIANVDTPGFKASDVHFEQKLQDALAAGPAAQGTQLARTRAGHINEQGTTAATALIQPEVVRNSSTTLRSDGNNVDIDQQMLRLSESAISYTALARLASSRLAFLKSVISEGRR